MSDDDELRLRRDLERSLRIAEGKVERLRRALSVLSSSDPKPYAHSRAHSLATKDVVDYAKRYSPITTSGFMAVYPNYTRTQVVNAFQFLRCGGQLRVEKVVGANLRNYHWVESEAATDEALRRNREDAQR